MWTDRPGLGEELQNFGMSRVNLKKGNNDGEFLVEVESVCMDDLPGRTTPGMVATTVVTHRTEITVVPRDPDTDSSFGRTSGRSAAARVPTSRGIELHSSDTSGLHIL